MHCSLYAIRPIVATASQLGSLALTEHLLAPLGVRLIAVDPLEVAACRAVTHGEDVGALASSLLRSVHLLQDTQVSPAGT